MKRLELKLKKDVLIVDAINEKIAYGIIFQKLGAKTVSDYEFICKGSELTEEIASELVEVDYSNFQSDDENYELKKNYIKGTFEFMSFEELFISAVESKGFYWLENHIEKPKGTSLNDSFFKMILDYNLENKWQEAEEKTFRNPLIFVKK